MVVSVYLFKLFSVILNYKLVKRNIETSHIKIIGKNTNSSQKQKHKYIQVTEENVMNPSWTNAYLKSATWHEEVFFKLSRN